MKTSSFEAGPLIVNSLAFFCPNVGFMANLAQGSHVSQDTNPGKAYTGPNNCKQANLQTRYKQHQKTLHDEANIIAKK